MKKSSIFKILTLFLTFIIFSCCSGCFLSFVDYIKERKLQKVLEIQKEQKALADALVPEIEGYIFEAVPMDAFKNQEDWESQGFKTFADFFRSGDMFEYNVKKDAKNTEQYLIYPSLTGKHEKEPIGYVISKEEHKKYFEVFPETSTSNVLFFNGEYFIYHGMVGDSYAGDRAGAIALFLLDFEKHEMYYVGYSKGWLEYEIEHSKLYSIDECCFKLTKNEGGKI